MVRVSRARGVEGRVSRDVTPRTRSGPEGSSLKGVVAGAVGLPGRSPRPGLRSSRPLVNGGMHGHHLPPASPLDPRRRRAHPSPVATTPDLDSRLREAAFAYLTAVRDRTGGVVSRSDIE